MDAAAAKLERDVAVLQTLLEQHYQPAATYAAADFRLSTHEVWERLNELAPLPELTDHAVYAALKGNGFELIDKGAMEFVWLMCRRT